MLNFKDPRHFFTLSLLLLIYLSSFRIHNFLYPVVFFQAFAFGHELAEGLFLFLFEHREGVKDVSEVLSGKIIKMRHIGIDFSTELGAIASVPAVGQFVLDPTMRPPVGSQVFRFISKSAADLLFMSRAIGVNGGGVGVPEYGRLPAFRKDCLPKISEISGTRLPAFVGPRPKALISE